MTDAAYDPVATLYDRAFADIRVRAVEYAWLMSALSRAPARPRVLDVGAGTGALLRALAPRIASGLGVDVSQAMLDRARKRTNAAHLSFAQTTDGSLPCADGSIDVAISFLSFRYLDWPRVWAELRRVLAPGGRILVIDLVAERATPSEVPRMVRAAARHALTRVVRPRFARDVQALTAHPDWAAMLRRHPIRPLDAYRTFFAEVLPSARFEPLDVLPRRRIVALDSGPLARP